MTYNEYAISIKGGYQIHHRLIPLSIWIELGPKPIMSRVDMLNCHNWGGSIIPSRRIYYQILESDHTHNFQHHPVPLSNLLNSPPLDLPIDHPRILHNLYYPNVYSHLISSLNHKTKWLWTYYWNHSRYWREHPINHVINYYNQDRKLEEIHSRIRHLLQLLVSG